MLSRSLSLSKHPNPPPTLFFLGLGVSAPAAAVVTPTLFPPIGAERHEAGDGPMTSYVMFHLFYPGEVAQVLCHLTYDSIKAVSALTTTFYTLGESIGSALARGLLILGSRIDLTSEARRQLGGAPGLKTCVWMVRGWWVGGGAVSDIT
jgi:hypothetical protein